MYDWQGRGEIYCLSSSRYKYYQMEHFELSSLFREQEQTGGGHLFGNKRQKVFEYFCEKSHYPGQQQMRL